MTWKIIRSLGSGGKGEVFLVKTPKGTQVALKSIHSLHDSNRLEFEKEVGLLTKIRHPHIISILGCAIQSKDIFGEDRGPCYWMEYFEGKPILSSPHETSPSLLFEALKKTLEALHFLHLQGVIHGDLSPQNLLMHKSGEVKLLDFGLTGFSEQDLNAVTIPYMAPEYLHGRILQAGDLYSLGVIFYEALSGKHPRGQASNLSELFSNKTLPLAEQAPHLTKEFKVACRVIDRLQEPDLSKRFQSAEEALKALQGEKFSFTTRGSFHSVQMYGAEAHFSNIQKAFKKISQQTQIINIHGITGVGKKRFLRECAFQAQLQNIKVQKVALTEISAVLKKIKKENSFEKTLYIFEDLQKAEDQELLHLLFLKNSELPPDNLILLFSWNEDALPENRRSVFQKLLQQASAKEIHLKNLRPGDVESYLKAALGTRADDFLVRFAIDQSKGNPLLLGKLTEEILANMPRGGLHSQHFERFRKLKSLQDVLQSRTERISENEKHILQLLALAKDPVSRSNLQSLLAPEMFLSLNSLQARELLNFDPHTHCYTLAIPSLIDSLLEKEAPSKLLKLHQEWWNLFSHTGVINLQTLRHALALGKTDYVIEHLDNFLKILITQGRNKEGLNLLDQALSLISEARTRSKLLKAKVNLLNEMDHFEDALKTADEWLVNTASEESESLRKTKYWLITGLGHQNLGNADEAAQRLEKCLESANPMEAEAKVYLIRAHSLLGSYEMNKGNLEKAESHFTQGLKLAGTEGRRRAEICRHFAELCSKKNQWQKSKSYFDQALENYREENYQEGIFATYLQKGNLALLQGDEKTTEASYNQAIQIAQDTENSLQLALAWNNMGIFLRKKGEYSQALDLLSQAQEIFQLLRLQKDLDENLTQYSITLAATGSFDEAAENIEKIHHASLKTEAETFLHEWKDGCLEKLSENHPSAIENIGTWNQELRLRILTRNKESKTASAEIRAILQGVYEKLPSNFQLRFVDRWDVKKWWNKKIIKKEKTMTENTEWSKIFNELTSLNIDLLDTDDIKEVLTRLMKTAIHLSKAENGLLLLPKTSTSKSPMPEFQVVARHNMGRKALSSEEFAPSLSVVKKAFVTGEAVVTDNALEDPHFKQAKSVRLKQLKSILALPIANQKEVIGIFYLDHQLQTGLFSPESLTYLKTFATLAALALQKSQMIEKLQENNSELNHEVEIKQSTLLNMGRELKKSRLLLKNEYGEIVTRSSKMLEVLSLLDRITDSKISVWIHGESGTGKELVARALHFNSARAQAPFISENCSAIPEALLESELFGHKKGAFTHAISDKQGILEYANKGTIFLDEIADLSLGLQSKLLRFLQEGEIRPVGSQEIIKVDVRVVSASNKNLLELVKEGKFREDLFFRLNGITVNLPPLRDRMEDFPLLADYFLDKIAHREKKKKCKLAAETLNILLKHSWPGNIRELQNILETAVLFAENGIITPHSLAFKPSLLDPTSQIKSGIDRPKEDIDPDLERILRAIRDEGYHRSNAAKALGISRRNLYTRLERHGVSCDLENLKVMIQRYLG